MDILTQECLSNETINFKSIFIKNYEELVKPTVFSPNAMSYGEFISSLGYLSHSLMRDVIKKTLEEMDAYFFNLKGRTRRYYSKGYRKRTIITVFGEVSYFRHEYIDRQTHKPFIYVDEKISLHRKDRYDPCVQAKIYEKYARCNSMIKVGEDIGQDLSSVFSIDDSRFYDSIPRQTVWKILHRFKKIEPPIKPAETPEILYVMADEKYIPSQNNNGLKLMTKEVIIHEGIKKSETIDEETGEVMTRNELIRPKRFINYDEDIYERVINYICTSYNSESIKQIYLMGDGGSWIKNGLDTLSGYAWDIKFGLDKFHFVLAVNTITTDPIYKHLIYYYSIKNMKEDLEYLIKLIVKDDNSRKEMINDKADYIKNNFEGIRAMYKYIKIGCAMEQAISHDLMSEFTSIPKAYSKKWLPYYLNERENYLNGYDLRKMYLAALDKLNKDDTEDNTVKLEPHLNTSFFDDQVKEEYYSLSKNVKTALHRRWKYTG